MSSSQQAVIALINRSTLLLAELNQTRRTNRDLERRLDQALARIADFEAGPPMLAAGDVMPSVLAAGARPRAGSPPLFAAPLRPVAGDGDLAA